MAEEWLPTLITQTPQEGYELAIKLSRVAVKKTQIDAEIRERLRAIYETDPTALINISTTVATNMHTVAVVNNFWRE